MKKPQERKEAALRRVQAILEHHGKVYSRLHRQDDCTCIIKALRVLAVALQRG